MNGSEFQTQISIPRLADADTIILTGIRRDELHSLGTNTYAQTMICDVSLWASMLVGVYFRSTDKQVDQCVQEDSWTFAWWFMEETDTPCVLLVLGEQAYFTGGTLFSSPFLLVPQLCLAPSRLSVYSAAGWQPPKERDVSTSKMWIFLSCEPRRSHSCPSRPVCSRAVHLGDPLCALEPPQGELTIVSSTPHWLYCWLVLHPEHSV